jgi:hypothetical protein
MPSSSSLFTATPTLFGIDTHERRGGGEEEERGKKRRREDEEQTPTHTDAQVVVWLFL